MKDSKDTSVCMTQDRPNPGKMLIRVAAGGLVIWAVGMVWYADGVFGRAWMNLAGIDPEAVRQSMQQSMGRIMTLSLLISFFSSLVLHTLFCLSCAKTLQKKLFIAFVAGAGVVGTTLFSGVLWEGKPVMLFLLSLGYYLTAFTAVAVVSSLMVHCPFTGDKAGQKKADGCCPR